MPNQVVLSIVLLLADIAGEGLKTDMLQGVTLEVGALGELCLAEVAPERVVQFQCVPIQFSQRGELLPALVANKSPRVHVAPAEGA